MHRERNSFQSNILDLEDTKSVEDVGSAMKVGYGLAYGLADTENVSHSNKSIKAYNFF